MPKRTTVDTSGVTPLELEHLEHVTLSERVYHQLRNALISGRLSLGQVVTLRGLATMLGTSVMPVRDAIRQLCAEGALELLPNRMIRVPELSLERFRELTRVRALLEGDLAAQAATQVSTQDVNTLKTINGEYQRMLGGKQSYLEISSVNQQFHFTIYRLANNRLALSLAETLWLRGGPYLATFEKLNQASLKSIQYAHHHTAILKALRARDAEATRRALAADILGAAQLFEQVFGLYLAQEATRKAEQE
jgi:DNA-binding GntR family transcriptional regulator